LADRFQLDRLSRSSTLDIRPGALLLPGGSRAGFVRVVVVILMLGFAAWVFLGNYELLFNSHAFMTGADYVDEKVTLPLRWLLIFAVLATLPLVWRLRYRRAIVIVVAFFVLQIVFPALVRAVYVRPNEISIERPYIGRHIQATTIAFGLNLSATERPFTAAGQEKVDAVQDATLLNNIRLWDLRAYNATITQIQALRPYYTFPETDVDRYFINGHIKQVLLSSREIDVNQLSAEATQSWIKPRFIYTHGFVLFLGSGVWTTYAHAAELRSNHLFDSTFQRDENGRITVVSPSRESRRPCHEREVPHRLRLVGA
jgi:uncharacterized membrane protein (UPF0182 family)